VLGLFITIRDRISMHNDSYLLMAIKLSLLVS